MTFKSRTLQCLLIVVCTLDWKPDQKFKSLTVSNNRSLHKEEVKASASNGTKPEENIDCGGLMCKKLIGKKGRKFWCKKCKEELQSVRQERLKQKKEIKICPECGIGIQSQSLVAHINQIHHAEKQICPHCSGVFANKHTLTGNLLWEYCQQNQHYREFIFVTRAIITRGFYVFTPFLY